MLFGQKTAIDQGTDITKTVYQYDAGKKRATISRDEKASNIRRSKLKPLISRDFTDVDNLKLGIRGSEYPVLSKPTSDVKNPHSSSPMSQKRFSSDVKSHTGTAIASDKNMMADIVQKYTNECTDITVQIVPSATK